MVTGVPVGRPTPPPPVASFDVFTPIRRPEQDGNGYPPEAGYPQPYPDFGNPAPEPGYANPYAGNSRGGDGGFGHDPGNDPVTSFGDGPGSAPGTTARPTAVTRAGIPAAALMPMACLAASAKPASFRSSARPRRRTPLARLAVPSATAASLTDMRNTLSAMQRGWQQGRSQTQRDTEGNTIDGD